MRNPCTQYRLTLSSLPITSEHTVQTKRNGSEINLLLVDFIAQVLLIGCVQ